MIKVDTDDEMVTNENSFHDFCVIVTGNGIRDYFE